MKIPSNKLDIYTQGVFVVLVQVAIFLATFFVATNAIAEEKILSEELSISEPREVQSLEVTDKEELISLEQDLLSSEPELSKEQQQELNRLDRQLEKGKITQEEYDKRKAEIIGVQPLEEMALMSRSLIEVEPESQTLGKYIAPTVSTINGSLNYSYQIVVPPGRSGLTPDLALTYNNGNKSHSSVIGTGWSLNIPYIQRVNKEGTDKLYTNSDFISSIDGELVDQGSGVYTPRTENGSFLKYEYSNSTWTVTDKEGTEYSFGSTVQARQDNPSDATQIFSWMLETVTDTNGNTISYTYFKDEGQIYPDKITYNQSGLFEVDFKRAVRSSSYTTYASGFEVTTDYRIDEIEISTDNSVTSTYDILATGGLVTDITLTGHEGTSSFQLPSLDLEYLTDSSDDHFASSYDQLNIRHYNAIRYGDLNGDGLTDAISSYKSGSSYRWYVYLNNGNGFTTTSKSSTTGTGSFISDPSFNWHSPIAQVRFASDGYYEEAFPISLQDMNGDGLADLVDSRTEEDEVRIYLNNGTHFASSYQQLNIRHYNTIRYGDLNGDGLTDIISSYKSGSRYRWYVYLNNGSGFTSTSKSSTTGTGNFISDPNFNWHSPIAQVRFASDGYHEEAFPLSLQDMNGDGLADLVDSQTEDDEVRIYLNNGTHFSSTYDLLSIRHYNTIRYGDLNGDGLTDIISSYKAGSSYRWYVYLNNGDGFTSTSKSSTTGTGNFISDPNFDWHSPIAQARFASDGYHEEAFPLSLQDMNGDGLADLVDSRTEEDEVRIYTNNSDHAFISKLTSPQGGETEFTYTTANIQDSSNEAPFPIHVVESVSTDDKNGNMATTSYEYRDADYYFNTSSDKRFAGFGSVAKTNPDGSIETTKYHQANGQTGNEPTDSYAKIGKVYEQSVTDGSGNTYELTRTNYTETSLGGSSKSIQADSVLTMRYDGTSSHTDTAVGYQYDGYGNITKETQYGEVSGNTDGSFADSGSDKRTTDITYTSNTTDYIVGLPTKQTLKNSSGTKVAETDLSYDSDGNLLTKSEWISGSNYADTTYTYNSYGLPLTETDPLSNTTTYVYDSDTMYPATVTNAENHTTSYSYDYSSGKPTQITEPNGKLTQYDYDGLDRLIEEEQTFANGGVQTVRTISYNTTAQPQYQKETLHRTSTDTQDIYTYLDGFGKTIQSKQEMDSGWLTLDTVFDAMDRVKKQSLPYQTSSSSNSSATTNSNLLTSFTLDPLGRVTSSINAKGTTTTDFDGFETTVTDAENNDKDLTSDAFGNLVQVVEHNGSSTYTTSYEYNTQNLLTKVTDAEGNVRNIGYDGLARRTSLEDLHGGSDSTFGTWSFVYDDINLTSQTDPKGTTTSYTYDDINRVLTEDNSSTVGTDITYSYDNCTNGSGMLCSVTTPDVTTSYTYLKQGLVDTVTKLIDAVSYTTNSDYNRQGQLTKVTHPNSSYTEYEYNTRGLVDNVKYNGTSLVTADYGVHGRPTSISHSNGVSSTLTYNASSLYELSNKTTTSGATDLQDLSYSYDDVGNITQIVDASDTDTAKTQSFTYDDLYRLTQATVTNSANSADYTRNYSYSPIGNITAFNGVSYSYTDNGYNNPHAVTSVGGTAYGYDNNGNLTSDGTWTHTWDYRNRLSSSTDGSNTSSYQYDHENMRTKLVEGSDTTIYPSAEYEVLNGNAKISLSLGETLVATDDNGTINHVHTDHLGGTNITTNTLGAVTQTLDYFPYGDTRIDTGTDTETKQYTGYTKDVSTGLHYAGARYYANDIGRFISQDPVALALGDWNMIQEKTKGDVKTYLSNPQKHNVYSYAFNNPVKYEDDNGEFALLTQYASIASYKSSTEYAGERLHQNGYGIAANQLSNQSYGWDFAISNPEFAGPIVGVSSGLAAGGIIEGITAYQGAIALSKIPEATIAQVVGKAGYGALSIHSASQIPEQLSNFLTDLGRVQNEVLGAKNDSLISGTLLLGPQALGHKGQTAWEVGSTTFETLDSVFEKKSKEKKEINKKPKKKIRR